VLPEGRVMAAAVSALPSLSLQVYD